MVRKIIKTVYWTFFICILILVGIKYFTPKPMPVVSPKLSTISSYNKKSKTYTNSDIGTYKYLGHTTDRGTFYLSKYKDNQRVVVLKFNFTNTSNHKAKPYTDLHNKLVVKQGNKKLITGNLQLNNAKSKLTTQTNNAVKIYQVGEHAKIALPYVYTTNGKTIKVFLDSHLLSKFR